MVVLVTLMVMVQPASGTSPAVTAKLVTPTPALLATPTQVPPTVADDICSPAANKLSVNARPVRATPVGLVIVNVIVEVPPAAMLVGANAFAIANFAMLNTAFAVFPVNPPAVESDLTPADPRELLLGVRRGDSTSAAAAAPPAPAEREGRQRLWRLLLVLAVMLLIVEMIVANRGWR